MQLNALTVGQSSTPGLFGTSGMRSLMTQRKSWPKRSSALDSTTQTQFYMALSSTYNISKLQRAQNVLARVVTRSHRRTSADALLHKLHWLPIEDRNVFKLALLTYKTLLIGSPNYLSTLLTIYRPPRTLRSSNSNLLCATRTKTVYRFTCIPMCCSGYLEQSAGRHQVGLFYRIGSYEAENVSISSILWPN